MKEMPSVEPWEIEREQTTEFVKYPCDDYLAERYLRDSYDRMIEVDRQRYQEEALASYRKEMMNDMEQRFAELNKRSDVQGENDLTEVGAGSVSTSQKVSKGIRCFYEAINNLHYATVYIDYQFRGSPKYKYIGRAKVFDGKKFDGKNWVDLCSVQGNDKAIMNNEVMIYIINQLNAIAKENEGISFTSVYNKNPQIIQRLVAEGVLIPNKDTGYSVSTTNEDIVFDRINLLLSLLGYTVRFQLGCFVFGRISP